MGRNIMVLSSIKTILYEKNRPGFQFVKYAVCGGVAYATDILTFFMMAWLFFPALTEDDMLVRFFNMPIEPVSADGRTFNFIIGNLFAFLVSNMTAYILNVMFVFKAGKYSRLMELGMFYLVSGISIGIGVAIGALLIEWYGLSTSFSYIAKSVSAIMINFVVRKTIIFHG